MYGRFSIYKYGFFIKPSIGMFCSMALLNKILTGIFIKVVLYKFNYIWCKNCRFTVRRFPFPGDIISCTVFLNCITGNSHRFCDMSLTFSGEETPAHFIVILHCSKLLFSIRIKRILFRVLF